MHTETPTRRPRSSTPSWPSPRRLGVDRRPRSRSPGCASAPAAPTTSFVPIIGPRTLAQLDDYLGALDVTLTAEQYARLDAVSAVPLGVPHEVSAGVRDTVLGGDASRVRPPRSGGMSDAADQLRSAECPIALGLEPVGEWWTMLILRDVFDGFAASTSSAQPRICPNDADPPPEVDGRRRPAGQPPLLQHPPRDEYVLTEAGGRSGR